MYSYRILQTLTKTFISPEYAFDTLFSASLALPLSLTSYLIYDAVSVHALKSVDQQQSKLLEGSEGGRFRGMDRATVAAWRSSGDVVGQLGRINEVILRRARLVLGWVTVFGG